MMTEPRSDRLGTVRRLLERYFHVLPGIIVALGIVGGAVVLWWQP